MKLVVAKPSKRKHEDNGVGRSSASRKRARKSSGPVCIDPTNDV